MMGESTEVCGLHGDLQKEVGALNKDIGKVAERLARVEQNTGQIPQMALDLQALKEQRAVSKSFIAGMMFVVSAIGGLVGVAINALISRGGHG